MKANGSTTVSLSEDLEHLRYLSVSTKEDVRLVPSIDLHRMLIVMALQIEMSRKSIKRIKLEADGLTLQPSGSLEELPSRPSSPEKGLRTPQSGAPLVNSY
jgi:hypothetical protein